MSHKELKREKSRCVLHQFNIAIQLMWHYVKSSGLARLAPGKCILEDSDSEDNHNQGHPVPAHLGTDEDNESLDEESETSVDQDLAGSDSEVGESCLHVCTPYRVYITASPSLKLKVYICAPIWSGIGTIS
jgi:hypothetical protein